MIEYLTMAEARQHLGISRTQMWRLVKTGILVAYSDQVDKRKKLVRKDDLDKIRLLQPRG